MGFYLLLNTRWKSIVLFGLLLTVMTVLHSAGFLWADGGIDWKSVNLQKKSLPSDLENIMKKVSISQSEVVIDATTIFYQSAHPPEGVVRSGKTILLLHGAAFSSQTWVDQVPTIACLSALGHAVVAVDLPGYGKSSKSSVGDKGAFLASLIKSLAGYKPIVVTPSMSGSFFIPMLMNKSNRELISGWVPVAPVGTTQEAGVYSGVRIPTMVVYGEKDEGLGVRSRDDLADLPNSSKPQEIPGAGHPAYLTDQRLWHTLLYNFIDNIQIIYMDD